MLRFVKPHHPPAGAPAGFRRRSDRRARRRRCTGWTRSNSARRPTLLYLGEAAAWSSVAEGAFAERLCAEGGLRVAVIDVRGRGDCAIAYPRRGRFYFPNRIPNEAYLTWFTLWLGRPLLGGQVYDALRTLDYLRSRPDIAGGVALMGDGAHGVIAMFAAALDEKVRGVALRQVVTDYRSLAVAERYTQPFGIYAYGLLREFDVPQVARAIGPRPVLLVNPTTDVGEPAGRAATELYAGVPNVTIHALDPAADPVQLLAAWATGKAGD